jgi:uncharacterized protein (DUF362 family)
MRSFALLAAVPATVWAAAYSEADYDSGRVHDMIMESKKVRQDRFTVVDGWSSADNRLDCLECYARAWRL